MRSLKSMLSWFYKSQDRITGFWGAKSRNNDELLDSGDLVSTEKVIKLFVDDRGNNINPEFPLQYQDKIFATTLQKLSIPMPVGLDEVHDWILIRNRGTRLLTKYLWKDASLENKNNARKLIEDTLRNRYQKFYVESEGSFSLYPGAKHADLDGAGEALGFLENIGALSSEKQNQLWGSPYSNITNLGTHQVSQLQVTDFVPGNNFQGVNSIRFYTTDPGTGDYAANVVAVHYPRATPVKDVVDLLPKIRSWVETTPQNMGNWVTKADILQTELAGAKYQIVPVSNGDVPLKLVNEVLQKYHQLVVIGFDELQVPKCKITFYRK